VATPPSVGEAIGEIVLTETVFWGGTVLLDAMDGPVPDVSIAAITSRLAKEGAEQVAEAVASAGAAATRGTSVLGHHPAYLEKAAELGARHFNIPPEIYARMSSAERWAANLKFLDRLITRGDEVILTTPVGRVTVGSTLEREVQYLLGRGYQVVDDGWRLIPGP
jgi:hypothetical protein